MMRPLAGQQRAFGHVIYEAVSLLVFSALFLGWVTRLELGSPAAGWVVAGAVLSASVLADLGSGLLHWIADTWGKQDWPIVGRVLFAPFREHHVDPKAITRHGFLETNGASASVATLVVLAAWACLPHDDDLWGLYASVVLAGMAMLGVATNQIHKWAHADRVPRWVDWLQRRGLILSPAVHDVHHVAPFATHYCITHGWLNPMLARLHFFRLLERMVSRITGLVPRQEDLAVVSTVSRRVRG